MSTEFILGTECITYVEEFINLPVGYIVVIDTIPYKVIGFSGGMLTQNFITNNPNVVGNISKHAFAHRINIVRLSDS